jgi:hypothetical protein
MRNVTTNTILRPVDDHTWRFAVPTCLALLHGLTAWLHGLSCKLVSQYHRAAESEHRALAELLKNG